MTLNHEFLKRFGCMPQTGFHKSLVLRKKYVYSIYPNKMMVCSVTTLVFSSRKYFAIHLSLGLIPIFHFLFPFQTSFSESPITEIFGGELRSAVHRQGAKESATMEPFFSLQLDIQVSCSSLSLPKTHAHGFRDGLTGH